MNQGTNQRVEVDAEFAVDFLRDHLKGKVLLEGAPGAFRQRLRDVPIIDLGRFPHGPAGGAPHLRAKRALRPYPRALTPALLLRPLPLEGA